MSDPDLLHLSELLLAAGDAKLYRKAARIAGQGAALATERGRHDVRAVFRALEGEYLFNTGDRAGAVSAFIEAARPDPEADPITTHMALMTLIEIATIDRPAAFTRRLIHQGREHLELSGNLAWLHMLDLRDADLARTRRDWALAEARYQESYEHRVAHNDCPKYTIATHQIRLANAAFRRRDAASLNHWRRALDDCDKEDEEDHLYAEQARLLCHRAGLPDLGEPVTAARALLRRLEGYEGDRAEFAHDALRVLALHRHWPPVDEWLPRPGIGDHWLLGGDLHLARAREALALPARDEGWSRDFERPDPQSLTPAQCAEARTHLVAARAHYESKLDWAAKEDQRLETDWYTRTLQARLQRVADLGPP